MPNTTVRSIPEDHCALVKQEARQRRSSINSEILDGIRNKPEEVKRRKRAARAMERIEKLQTEIAKNHPNQQDSVEIIREIRDSR